MRHVIAACVAFSTVAVVCGQQNAPPTEFEVATVKPQNPNPQPVSFASIGPKPGHWLFLGPLVKLIEQAYPTYGFDSLVVGGPPWIRDLDTKWDIDARMDPKTPREQVPPMVAHLLADRFGFRFHTEQRMVPVYVLKMVRADGQFGPKLKRSAEACVAAKTARQPLPVECRGAIAAGGGQNAVASQVSEIVQLWSIQGINRPVIDRTSLQGYFDLQLAFNCGPFAPVGSRIPARVCGPDGVSFFTALQEQAGLKLEPSREMADVLVVDSVRMPDPD